jgi:hypothetical protein
MTVKTTDRVEDSGNDLDELTMTAEQPTGDQPDDEDESEADEEGEEGEEAKGDSPAS